MSDLITIIVPVYNGATYMKRCMDSILNQTYPNYEILIVDDGSTDATAEIAEEYVRLYPNVRMIHKENAGLPQARKTGVENAKGRYIGFVDVDDWIDADMYEQLYRLCITHDAEIAACGMIFEFGTKGIPQFKSSEEVCIYNHLEALRQVNQRKNVRVYVWNKLYQKTVFEGVEFATGNFVGEDYDIVTKVLSKDVNLVWTPQCKYHYFQATGTMSHCGFSDMHKLSYNMYKKRCQILCEAYPEYREEFENYVLTEYIMFVKAMSRNKKYDNVILEEIKEFVKKHRKQYCKADYIPLKFKLSVRAFCIHYRLFVFGYSVMENVRYLLMK